MGWIVVGLGNPGKEYEGTRHNTGRDLLIEIAKSEGITGWTEDKKTKTLSAKGVLFDKKVLLILPNSYMNNSGRIFASMIGLKKDTHKLVILQDELDLSLGAVKVSFGNGAGGHKGIESIHKALRTRDMIRIRIGISPITRTGVLKKPPGAKVVDFVLGTFSSDDRIKLKKVRSTVREALNFLLVEGLPKAMTEINSR